MTDTPAPTFEQQLQALEQLVNQLERNELPLDKALEAYSKGTALVSSCQKLLALAEVRLTEITTKAQANG